MPDQMSPRDSGTRCSQPIEGGERQPGNNDGGGDDDDLIDDEGG